MSKEEIRAFLTRWVMEMGSSTFDWTKPIEQRNAWYNGTASPGVYRTAELWPFFTLEFYVKGDSMSGVRTITINQAGLNFIKGEEHGSDDQ